MSAQPTQSTEKRRVQGTPREAKKRRLLSVSEFCVQAPKIELHVHLDGAFDGSFLYACATKYVDELPPKVDIGDTSVQLQQVVRSATREQDFLKQHIYLPASCAKLTDFLAPFPLSMAIVKTAVRAEGSFAPIEELAYLFAKRQSESNVIYTEVRSRRQEAACAGAVGALGAPCAPCRAAVQLFL